MFTRLCVKIRNIRHQPVLQRGQKPTPMKRFCQQFHVSSCIEISRKIIECIYQALRFIVNQIIILKWSQIFPFIDAIVKHI